MNSENYKVVCITGASRGIGRALCIGFAKKNYKIGMCSRKEVDLEVLGKKIKSFGGDAYWQAVDVTKRDQVKDFANNVYKKYGRIDVWINNAGIMPITLIENLHEDEWDQIVDLNCKGVLNGVGACVEIMKKQRSGHIVNISSDAGKRHFDCLTVYCASKYFVEGLAIGLRRELKKYNIRVTNIQPGDVHTDIGWGSTDKQAIQQYYGSTQEKEECSSESDEHSMESEEHSSEEEEGNDHCLATQDIFNAVYYISFITKIFYEFFLII